MWLFFSAGCKGSEDLTAWRGGGLNFSSISWSYTPWEVRCCNDHTINDQGKYEFMCLQTEVKSSKVRVSLEGKIPAAEATPLSVCQHLLRLRLLWQLFTYLQIAFGLMIVVGNNWDWPKMQVSCPEPSLWKDHIWYLEPEDKPANTGIAPFPCHGSFPGFCTELMGQICIWKVGFTCA